MWDGYPPDETCDKCTYKPGETELCDACFRKKLDRMAIWKAEWEINQLLKR